MKMLILENANSLSKDMGSKCQSEELNPILSDSMLFLFPNNVPAVFSHKPDRSSLQVLHYHKSLMICFEFHILPK